MSTTLTKHDQHRLRTALLHWEYDPKNVKYILGFAVSTCMRAAIGQPIGYGTRITLEVSLDMWDRCRDILTEDGVLPECKDEKGEVPF